MPDQRAIPAVVFFSLILCVHGQETNETTTTMKPPREDNGTYIVEELQYVNSFRPCDSKRDFCKILCPTYCNRYDEEAQRYESCQCSGCYCRCSTIKNETMKRDAQGNLVCSRLVFGDGEWRPEGLVNGKGDLWPKVVKIAAETTTPSTTSMTSKKSPPLMAQRFFARPQAPIIPIVHP
ncbi:hypothetical protein M3Y99_01557600 [Aphelenchoides fujianensis]|nr:hypothetical protein M3Y99_01557600 [Aphelenchoides fujianensis]